MIFIKLDELLKQKGISQREFSRRTGIRQPTISEMCLNKSKSLPVENLNLICIELDCKIEELIEFKKEQSE
ncbi:helix-turn-helix domain-containing protein [Cytobacillus sp. FJAT-53684]|uniref:Helix-turn-helix domain-containing protein n=1 Tax=Cytobacillus mangrovibacter TaxID=3299024 RepID=A0ABW6K2M4_9BACI